MEGRLFACLPAGKLAWRRSQASDFRRHLGPGSSSLRLPGGQLAWEAVNQTPPGKSVGDEGRGGRGGAEGDDGSPPPIGTPTLSSVDKGPGQKQIPPKAPMPPPSMPSSDGAPPPGSHRGPAMAVLDGLDKKEKSSTYLWDASCSKTKEDIKENRGAPLPNIKGISSPDPLCDCVASTKTIGNADANRPVRSTNVAKSLTQLFVKVCQKEVSLQEDFNTTTIKELIDSACHKAEIKACDFYAVYGGKRLNADKPIAYYPIFKDSTVHLRSRLRAGREYGSETFDAFMSQNMGKRFRQVNLSALSENISTKKSSITFLSEFSANFIHKIMIYICGIHRAGRSFDGRFTAKNILIINKTMVDFDIRPTYNFSADTCSNDYMALFNIFTTYFIEAGIPTAKFFTHFLNYLFHCPAKGKSNSEPVIKFITNHPALTSYMDRIKQCVLLDSMIRRLDATDVKNLGSGGTYAWATDAQNVPALGKVYLYNSKFDHSQNKRIVNAHYTSCYLGCLRFARNYFSHADYQLKLLEVEAAFANALEDFLPEILLNVALHYTLPAYFDKLTLLGNPLADYFELSL